MQSIVNGVFVNEPRLIDARLQTVLFEQQRFRVGFYLIRMRVDLQDGIARVAMPSLTLDSVADALNMWKKVRVRQVGEGVRREILQTLVQC